MPVRDGRPGPSRVTIDSRNVGAGDLFVGLVGEHRDGGAFAAQALAAGAWGVLVRPQHAEMARRGRPGVVLAADDPLGALQRLATRWRRELGCKVIGVTGSTGKTSTKDLLRGMLEPHRRVVATEQNLNTEIGLPLTILRAPAGTEVLVLEMAMRGAGQIAELVEIAEPDVGVVVNVGPVHLELLGSVEAVAATKAELIRDLPAHGTAVVPAGRGAARSAPARRHHHRHLRAGRGRRRAARPASPCRSTRRTCASTRSRRSRRRARSASSRRARSASRSRACAASGSRCSDDVVVINDCYNANPMSMRAALDDLAETAAGRRVAVLGDMLELGPQERHFHAELGDHARAAGVEVLVTVGDLAAEAGAGTDGEAHNVRTATEAAKLLPTLLQPGDTVLVKGSRGVGLEVVAEALEAREA